MSASTAAQMSLVDQDMMIPLVSPRLPSLVGPFFLGFICEAFGMGVVLVLSINYFTSIILRPKAPAESSRRLGVVLVGTSLALSLAQTIVDSVRGYQMFAINFLSLPGFFRPTYLFFLSPFLGVLCALISQSFLLRRVILFITSLELLWPRLARPAIKYTFAVIMSGVIANAAIAGCGASVMIWRSPSLMSLKTGQDAAFQAYETNWLVSSAVVDIILSVALCSELWWARRKLAIRGGLMREVVTKLILTTLHGGCTTAVVQLSVLLQYKFMPAQNAWCYLGMLFLPKIYTISLILSLTLPRSDSTTSGPSPSAVFSLPTIRTHDDPPHSIQHVSDRRSSSPAALSPGRATVANEQRVVSGNEKKKRWSLVLGGKEKRGVNDEKDERWAQNWSFGGFQGDWRMRQSWRRENDGHIHARSLESPQFQLNDERRPSEPTSLSPLLNTPPSGSSTFRRAIHPPPRLLAPVLPVAPPTSVVLQRHHSSASTIRPASAISTMGDRSAQSHCTSATAQLSYFGSTDYGHVFDPSGARLNANGQRWNDNAESPFTPSSVPTPNTVSDTHDPFEAERPLLREASHDESGEWTRQRPGSGRPGESFPLTAAAGAGAGSLVYSYDRGGSVGETGSTKGADPDEGEREAVMSLRDILDE